MLVLLVGDKKLASQDTSEMQAISLWWKVLTQAAEDGRRIGLISSVIHIRAGSFQKQRKGWSSSPVMLSLAVLTRQCFVMIKQQTFRSLTSELQHGARGFAGPLERSDCSSGAGSPGRRRSRPGMV